MILTLVTLLLEAAYLATALPAGGSGGSRGGSGGGSRGGGSKSGSGGSKSSSGGSGSSGSSGSGYRYNNGYRGGRSSGPLSKGGKIALAVVFGVIGLIVLIVVIYIVTKKLKSRSRERKLRDELIPEKQSLASSHRTSFDEPASLSYNPGHTQAAVHPVLNPTSNSELTSAVMAGEGSKAGHGQDGAGDGSRGGVGSVAWDARALAAISHGMSNEAHRQG
ncbi:hypothetical protein FRC08_007821 [Ceratobasidium sp. 394]|nr:hypothetical protein FRC08_007821 [Ceratobasidium sp. 394]KAG9082873.1 hypothetical protein FS749_006508 [Ceratobasidium sp. UAMH 11750]